MFQVCSGSELANLRISSRIDSDTSISAEPTFARSPLPDNGHARLGLRVLVRELGEARPVDVWAAPTPDLRAQELTCVFARKQHQQPEPIACRRVLRSDLDRAVPGSALPSGRAPNRGLLIRANRMWLVLVGTLDEPEICVVANVRVVNDDRRFPRYAALAWRNRL